MVLLLGSLLFYSYGSYRQPAHILLMIFSILINYLTGRLIDGKRNPRERRKWLAVGLIYNFTWLFLFKLPMTGWTLPIGISFYTFQMVSYLADVYWRRVRAEDSIVRLGVYLCMFPQLIAGPIVSYRKIASSLRKRKVTADGIEWGLRTFVIGLGMKVLLANQLGKLWNDVNTIGYESISTQLAWLGILGFSLQIYFDFYGYSLMAMGLGKLMGFQLPVNFKHPYMALTMTEFLENGISRWETGFGNMFIFPLAAAGREP